MLNRLIASLSALALVGCATIDTPSAQRSAGVAQTASSSQSGDAAKRAGGWRGAVTSADPRAEAAGMEILAAGGSATDAAIAVMLALTVVEPQSSGIGGGGFFVRAAPDGAVATIDGRETAPAGATPDWFLNPDGTLPPFAQSVHSGLSVGVPGNLRLAELAHQKYGKLPWKRLFDPAIRLAREGFRINLRLHNYLVKMPDHAGWNEYARQLFYDEQGKARAIGTLVRNEKLARTLELIAAKGADAFYTGALAQKIAETVASHTPREGAMTVQDLANYRAIEREAVCSHYRRHRVCSMGPPTSGGIALLQILGMLERFDLEALGKDNPVTWHLFLEAQRLAYADREIYLADPDFVKVPVSGLLDRAYLARRSALISPDATLETVAAGRPEGADLAFGDGDEPVEFGTSHFAVVGPDEAMVSYTSTIEGLFGSGLMVEGFYLNNELTDFSRSPRVDGRLVANRVEGGKRPRSSMTPTLVWDPKGKPLLAVGAAGGSTIPITTTRAVIGVIDFGLDAKQALALPFAMAFGERVLLEKGTWLETAADRFRALGHDKIVIREAAIKGNAISRGANGWLAARDPRIDVSLAVP